MKYSQGLVAYSVGIEARVGTMAAGPVKCFFRWRPLPSLRLLGGEVGNAQRSDPVTPLARWRTVDDLTGKINSFVTIREEDGKLYGRMEWLMNPDPNDPDPRCLRCAGDLKGLLGLQRKARDSRLSVPERTAENALRELPVQSDLCFL